MIIFNKETEEFDIDQNHDYDEIQKYYTVKNNLKVDMLNPVVRNIIKINNNRYHMKRMTVRLRILLWHCESHEEFINLLKNRLQSGEIDLVELTKII